jgi:hypothetical protein
MFRYTLGVGLEEVHQVYVRETILKKGKVEHNTYCLQECEDSVS